MAILTSSLAPCSNFFFIDKCVQDVRQRDLPLFDAQLLDAGERPLLPGPLLRCLYEEVGQVCHRPGPQDGCGGETKI